MDSENSSNKNNNNNSNKVQHVNKKSSDELLRKFADDEEALAKSKELLRLSKRRRRSQESRECDQCESPTNGQGSKLVERRSLLPTQAKKSVLLRQLGIHGRARLKGREIRHKSLFGTIEKVRLI